MPDLTALTDTDLDALRRDVLIEQERRQRLADSPAQIGDAIRAACDAGVATSDLRAVVEVALAGESSPKSVANINGA